ncbi:MAG: hypothetical protein ABIS67_13780 [Candidatus Eisenbacteria bacterium]
MRLSIPVCSKAVVLAFAIVTFAPFAALAGWGPDGATIKSTTNNIPKVAATNDGGHGTIVAWQEENSPGSGLLRAQRVLVTGDVDPAWAPDGVVICNVATSRAAIGVVPDALGGAYVWWKEGAAIFLTRVISTGAIAPNWPARGRQVGTAWPSTARPSVIADGATGIYAAWPGIASGQVDPVSVQAIHLGPTNTGAGGWPNGPRTLAGWDPVATFEYWPQIALAPDGGAFLAWASHSSDPETMTSSYRLRRVTSAGLNATGWAVEGNDLGVFHGEWLDINPETGLIGLSEDGLGGVFALIGFLTSSDGYNTTLESRLFRLLADGSPAPAWPVEGSIVQNGGIAQYWDVGPDASHRVFPDGLGGAQVGKASYYGHGTDFALSATLPEGGWKPSSSAFGNVFGHEVVPNSSGGVFLGDFSPSGPTGPYQPWAYLRVGQSLAPAGWSQYFEIHYDNVVQWYGDIALAQSGDGGAIFFWSQVRERFGLFARRFNGAGEVTAVETPLAESRLSLSRLRFVVGDGVRVSFVIPVGAEASFDLYDVTGRRVAATRMHAEAGGAREVTVPGTRQLAAGLYFAKLATAGDSRAGKVVVAR